MQNNQLPNNRNSNLLLYCNTNRVKPKLKLKQVRKKLTTADSVPVLVREKKVETVFNQQGNHFKSFVGTPRMQSARPKPKKEHKPPTLVSV